MRWLLRNPPELYELSAEDQRSVGKAAVWKLYRHWQWWAVAITPILLSVIGVLVAGNMLGSYIGLFIGFLLMPNKPLSFAVRYNPHLLPPRPVILNSRSTMTIPMSKPIPSSPI